MVGRFHFLLGHGLFSWAMSLYFQGLTPPSVEVIGRFGFFLTLALILRLYRAHRRSKKHWSWMTNRNAMLRKLKDWHQVFEVPWHLTERSLTPQVSRMTTSRHPWSPESAAWAATQSVEVIQRRDGRNSSIQNWFIIRTSKNCNVRYTIEWF